MNKPVNFHHEYGVEKPKSRKPLIIASAVVAIVVVGLIFLLWPSNQAEAPAPADTVAENQPVVEQSQPAEPEKELFNAMKLQNTLDAWLSEQSGVASVVIADEDGEILARRLADRQYFAASIYKLYVAYEGYRKIDDGTHKLSEPFLAGQTRKECLDKMIRTSDSPCAEKLWVELGKAELDDAMQEYGLKDTSMVAITTSARDAAVILSRIATGEGLSKASQQKFLASMKGQIYRDALPVGFTDSTVYDKVGFNGQKEYHDVAIVKLEHDRQLIVSVLTERVGTSAIADLAARIEKAAQ